MKTTFQQDRRDLGEPRRVILDVGRQINPDFVTEETLGGMDKMAQIS